MEILIIRKQIRFGRQPVPWETRFEVMSDRELEARRKAKEVFAAYVG